MSSYHSPKTDILIYPIHTVIFEDFLEIHDFVPFIAPEATVFKIGNLRVEVPHLKKLSKNAVGLLLGSVNISVNEFEEYYKYCQQTKEFNRLIDLSLHTLKKNKK